MLLSPTVQTAVPSLPKPPAQESGAEMANAGVTGAVTNVEDAAQDTGLINSEPDNASAAEQAAPVAPVKAAPTSWANLFAKPASQSVKILNGANGTTSVNGDATEATTAGAVSGSNFSQANRSLLADAIQTFKVNNSNKATLVEPRGLVNTGNMCYMNSVCLAPPKPCLLPYSNPQS